jgi:hypothetical protein
MRTLALTLATALLLVPAVSAQQQTVTPDKLVAWMRTVNTLEAEYNAANHKYADTGELLAFAKAGKTGTAVMAQTELSPSTMGAYSLQVITSTDGKKYAATIRALPDTHKQDTWCKTAAFSDQAGLISLGQNIQCSGAQALGTQSKPAQ